MTIQHTLLVVDDTPANLTVLTHLLRDTYRIKVANSGVRALELVNTAPPDLILLDVSMPEMDGYEVCRRLKANPKTAHVPVIFLTARTEIQDEEAGFAVGAVDFIHKPVSPGIVRARIKTHLDVKAWHDFLADRNAGLSTAVSQQLSDIHQLQDAAIYAMVSMAEFRDECTGNHVRRTCAYVDALANKLAESPKWENFLSPACISQIVKSAPLHDIGKIAIPDGILLKPGKLTAAEFDITKTHATRGYEILRQAGDQMGARGTFLKFAMEIAHHHHEKWDGNGYPQGLAGEEIPLSARLMAVADVYDALISRRPYKAPISHQEAINYIAGGRGSQFDPEIVDALLSVQDKIDTIAHTWLDTPLNPELHAHY